MGLVTERDLSLVSKLHSEQGVERPDLRGGEKEKGVRKQPYVQAELLRCFTRRRNGLETGAKKR